MRGMDQKITDSFLQAVAGDIEILLLEDWENIDFAYTKIQSCQIQAHLFRWATGNRIYREGNKEGRMAIDFRNGEKIGEVKA